MMLKSILNFILMASVLTGCITRFDPSSEFGRQQIVFISTRTGYKDVYRSDIYGRHVRALTHDVSEDANPHIMPNGGVVFASNRTGTWQIYVMEWDGSQVKALTTDRAVNNYRPFPASDGRIVFVSDRDLRTHIYSIKPDGSDLRQLTSGETYNDQPVASEEGYIYFTSSRSSKWEVWRMLADGSHPEQITHTLQNVLEVAVIPTTMEDKMKISSNRTAIPISNFVMNQPKVVYVMRAEHGYSDIYRQNLDGSDVRDLTHQKQMDRSPVISPSGHILFTSDRGGNTNVWKMTPDGQEPLAVIAHPAYDSTN